MREKESQAKGEKRGMENMRARHNRTHFPCIYISGCIEKFIVFAIIDVHQQKHFRDKTPI